MPGPRTIFNTILLPIGKVLFINGASSGYAGVEGISIGSIEICAAYFDQSLMQPARLRVAPLNSEVRRLSPSTIARPFQASATLAHDGRVILAGGSPYTFPAPAKHSGAPCNCLCGGLLATVPRLPDDCTAHHLPSLPTSLLYSQNVAITFSAAAAKAVSTVLFDPGRALMASP
eukprot:SM000095S24967  [mRNA]  locus=s95:100049:100707:- [translate_table: standard]